MTRIALTVTAVSAILAVPFAWLAGASAIYCSGINRPDLFVSPFTQWLDVLPYWRANWWVTLWVVVSAAVPSAAMAIIIYAIIRLWLWRRSRPTSPRPGSERPLQPGVSDNFGHATILTDKEALQRFPGPPGMVIGETLRGPAGSAPLVIDPILNDAGNGVVVAGNGAGKTSSLVTMLMYWPGSAVVLDPKLELAGMMRDALESDGRRVEVVSTAVAGSGFNAIGWINPAKPMAGMDIKSIISWIFPDDKEESAGSKDPYFEPTGKSLCAAILADLIWSDRPPSEKTLMTFRSIVVTAEDKMRKIMQTISVHSKSALARDLANTLKGITPKQWSGVYGQATQGTEWLSDPDLARLVSGNSFRVQDVLDGSTVVFAQIPIKTMMQAPGVGRVIIGSILNAVYDEQQTHGLRTGFFLDEAWSLGKMAIQRAALVTGRSFGVTIIWFYQSVGQMKDIWGKNGISTLYNNLSWRAYVAVKDHEAAEEISQDMGEISVMAFSEGKNSGAQRPPGTIWSSRSHGTTSNINEIKRRLVLPQEIKNAARDIMFVIAGDANMRLRTPLFFNRRELADAVHPSRLYRRSPALEPDPQSQHALVPARLRTRTYNELRATR